MTASAKTGEGMEAARAAIEDRLPQFDIELEVLLPYDRGDLVNRLHEQGDVLELEHTGNGSHIRARMGAALAGELEPYVVESAAG